MVLSFLLCQSVTKPSISEDEFIFSPKQLLFVSSFDAFQFCLLTYNKVRASEVEEH